MKDHRHNARVHDVSQLGCSPSSDQGSTVVGGGHPSLDRALARAAARSVAQPPVSELRAACLATHYATTVRVEQDAPASGGRPLDGTIVTSSREDETARVMHVATLRDVHVRDRWYRIRVWHELSTISSN